MTRAVVAEWRATGRIPSDNESVLIQIGVRRSDGKIVIGCFAPDLDQEVGDPIGLFVVSPEEAARLMDRLMQSLDQVGKAETVDRKLEARLRARAEG